MAQWNFINVSRTFFHLEQSSLVKFQTNYIDEILVRGYVVNGKQDKCENIR